MGRFADLCGEIAAALEENADGLTLPPEAWDRFRPEWQDDDIEDAMGLVQESLMQDELVDAADSLSSRLVDWLAEFGNAEGWTAADAGRAQINIDVLGQITRRVARLEEALERYRDTLPPDNPGFTKLRQRLANHGIENEMTSEDEDEETETGSSLDGDDEDQ